MNSLSVGLRRSNSELLTAQEWQRSTAPREPSRQAKQKELNDRLITYVPPMQKSHLPLQYSSIFLLMISDPFLRRASSVPLISLPDMTSPSRASLAPAKSVCR